MTGAETSTGLTEQLLAPPRHAEDAEQGQKPAPVAEDDDVLVLRLPSRELSHHSAHAAGNGWKTTTIILLADMFGLGALAIPSAFARLGWLVASAVVLLLGSMMWYSGSLFTRLACCRPGVQAYHELAGAAYGARGRWLVFGTVYTLVLLSPAIIHLTSAESLKVLMGPHAPVSPGLAVALCMLPLAQVRSMEDVGWASLVGTGTMVGAVLVTLGWLGGHLLGTGSDLAPAARDDVAATHVLPPRSTTLAAALVAVLDIVFAYGGAQNWFRYATTMRRRSQFSLVTRAGAAVMTLFYVLLGAVGYLSMGDGYDLRKPITSVLPPGAWVYAINVLLLLHCLVAYQININVLTHLLLGAAPAWARDRGGWEATAAWAAVSCAGVLASWGLAAGVPYFNAVIAFAGAIGDVSAGYLVPALLALKLLPLGAAERAVCRLLVPLAVALSAAGIFAAVREMARQGN